MECSEEESFVHTCSYLFCTSSVGTEQMSFPGLIIYNCRMGTGDHCKKWLASLPNFLTPTSREFSLSCSYIRSLDFACGHMFVTSIPSGTQCSLHPSISPSLHPPFVHFLENELVCRIHSSQRSLASPVYLSICLQVRLSTLKPLLQDNHVYPFIPYSTTDRQLWVRESSLRSHTKVLHSQMAN